MKTKPKEPTPEVKYDRVVIGVAILLGILIGGIITVLYLHNGGSTYFIKSADCNLQIENIIENISQNIYLQGTLYTSESGMINYRFNNTIQQIEVAEVCYNLNNQEVK